MNLDLAEQLASHPRWGWREGMKDHEGVRVVDLDLWSDTGSLPDLGDFATAGVLIEILSETGMFTDLVLQDSEWIVAVDLPGEGLKGWAADTIGEAAAWALLDAWASLPEEALA